MTPQERQRVDELFDRLASLETTARDRDAEQVIADGQRRAPHAIYALVQTVLLQDDALRAAEARIAEIERQGPEQSGAEPRGFLDSVRDSIFGGASARGSVPSVRPGGGPSPWSNARDAGMGQNSGWAGAPQAAPSAGGSFLGTAAAAAAGMIGGSLLMNSLSGMFGGRGGQSMFDSAQASEKSASPWSDSKSGDTSGGDLGRDAGLGDIGGSNRQGLFGSQDGQRDANLSSAGDDNYGAYDTADYGDDSDFDDSDFA